MKDPTTLQRNWKCPACFLKGRTWKRTIKQGDGGWCSYCGFCKDEHKWQKRKGLATIVTTYKKGGWKRERSYPAYSCIRCGKIARAGERRMLNAERKKVVERALARARAEVKKKYEEGKQ